MHWDTAALHSSGSLRNPTQRGEYNGKNGWKSRPGDWSGAWHGRAHAVRLAEEGADILALDCPPDTGLPYPTGSRADLQITVKEVEGLGRRIIAQERDARKQSSIDNLVTEGVKAFGGLDVAVANAGIWTVRPFADIPEDEFAAVLDVNITGV